MHCTASSDFCNKIAASIWLGHQRSRTELAYTSRDFQILRAKLREVVLRLSIELRQYATRE